MARTPVGSIATAWLAGGGLSGSLGAPYERRDARRSRERADVPERVLHWSPSSGVHRMTTAVLDAYVAGGASAGPLGDPSATCTWRRGAAGRRSIVVRNGVAEVVPG